MCWVPRFTIHIIIQDTGIGIKDCELELLFKPFTQIIDTKSRKDDQGTGLGLSIVKLLSENMGGKTWVESEYDKGSKFHVLLNLNKTTLKPKKSISNPLMPKNIKKAHI